MAARGSEPRPGRLSTSVPDPSRRPILVVTPVDPRAPRNGVLIRVEAAIRALGEIAPVEVVVIHPGPEGRPPQEGPLPSTVRRTITATYTRRLTLAGRLGWVLRPTRPLTLVGRDHTQLRRDVGAWLSPDYSLAWIVGTTLHDAVAPLLPGCPVVVDVNDLESDKLAGELRVRRGSAPPRGVARRARHEVALLQGRRNVHAWLRFDRAVARGADLALVCSAADVPRLDAGRVAVVPNAYPTPERPLGRVAVGSPPTILLQGAMTYPPNVDAAQFLVREILPRVREAIPDVRLRIVGRAGDGVRALAQGERVVVTGYVPDLDHELARADLVVVPVRFGGGTRIKIIEAFAHGIPVVSTGVGAFGLGAVDGESILLADEADTLAAACVRALTDPARRSALASAGRACFERSYRVEAVHEDIIGLAWSLLP